MIKFDSNGIHENSYGAKLFKRIATFIWDGECAKGGVYIAQSTEDLYLVELFEISSQIEIEDGVEEIWTPTGKLIQVPRKDIIQIDEHNIRTDY